MTDQEIKDALETLRKSMNDIGNVEANALMQLAEHALISLGHIAHHLREINEKTSVLR